MTARREPRIEFEPAVVCSVAGGRLEIMLRGRALSSAPVEELSLLRDGRPLNRLTFGLPEMDGSVRLADEPMLRQYAVAFIVAHDMPETAETLELTTLLAVHGEPPRGERLALRVEPDPAGGSAAPRVRIEAGAVAALSDGGDLLPPVVLQLERAELDPEGNISLSGWAVSLHPVITIQVFLGEERLGAAQIGLARDDVQAVFRPYANALQAGFRFSGKIEPGRAPAARVRVQVIALNGVSQECVVALGAPGRRKRQLPAAAPPPEPPPQASGPPPAASAAPPDAPESVLRLHCDEATLFPGGDLVVAGWCVGESLPIRIAVELGGVSLGLAETGRDRPDVGLIYGAMPDSARSGFRLRVKLDEAQVPGAAVTLLAEDARSRRRRAVHPLAVIASPDAGPADEAAAPAPGVKFNLDAPAVERGAAREVVTGHMTIEGWVVASSPVEAIDVSIGGERLGTAYYGLARQDVAAALPEWPNALRSGFAFHCPPRALRNGDHVVTIDCRLEGGGLHSQSFRISVAKPADSESGGAVRRRVSRVEADFYERTLTGFGWDRRFLVVLRDGPAGLDEEELARRLRLTLGALRGQAACRPRLLLGEASGPARALLATEFADLPPHVPAGDAAGREVLLPLSPGDELGCDALAELALALVMNPGADMAYADESRLIADASAGLAREPFCKPGWSPELLLAADYIGRPWCADADVAARAGLAPADFGRLSNHDLLLRCAEQSRSVQHVPHLLCRSAEEPPDAEPGLAVQQAADRRGLGGRVEPGRAAGSWRLVPSAPAPGSVSVVIPTCGAQEHVRACIRTLRAYTAGRKVEIVVIDNVPPGMAELKAWLAFSADVVVDIPEAFNWSRFNNRAVEASSGDYLLFLNDDVEATHDGWLEAMVELARRPDVGAVGAQLLYPDGKVQHAGMFLSRLGQARHAFRFLGGDDPGPFGLALTQRNVVSVTGACMMVRRDTFDALGGFDEAHDVINNDLDFCLRLGAAGRRVVYSPDASLIHHELASRAALGEDFDTSRFEGAWRSRFVAGDPYHGPALSKHHDDHRPEDEPVRVVHGGHPLFGRGDIKRILALKVDHIGDFITALPVFRRLRHWFPDARICVLASRAARSVAHLEDSIDEVIEFEFFHVKSALGRKDMESDELAALRDRLAPLRFDLAIDLRKHLDTRELLRWTGATWLAGFDHLGRFPWLDVALEWEGDRGLHPKRFHVTDDLLHLVDAVGTATEPGRGGIRPERVAEAAAALRLPPEVDDLFRAPVACIHAGAGNPLKQWPPEYFATLVDLLLTRGLNVLFVGGPDEAEVTQEIVDRVLAFDGPPRGDRIGSLVGALKLGDLPAAISRCAIYVGNDSGPKHIAAAVGVPTVGIHSGTVDPNEWAPMGPGAVAIHRAMTCSPCYIVSADRCPRALACLGGIEPMAVMRVCERLLALREPPPSAAAPAADEWPEEPPPEERQAQEPQPTRGSAPLAELATFAALMLQPLWRRPWLPFGRPAD